MTMLQQYNHLDQKGQDLISLFVSPSSTRTACPICRENCKDSDGSHLVIGDQGVHCFSDPEHGKTLFREIKQTERGSELPPRKPAPPSKPTKKKAKFVKRLPRGTHYEYHDQYGQVCFVAVRLEPKRFLQYTVVNGGYECRGLDGPRPLFRLNDIKPDGPVIVVEGEKATEALIRAGCPHSVTTFSQGSNAWQKTDYSPLVGREVWLIADADKPGRKCMKGLAGHLQGLRCTVKIMLPDGDDGADVADWLESHDLETVLDTIAAGLVDYKPSDPFEALRVEVEETIKNNDERSFRGLLEDGKDAYFRTVKESFRYGWVIGRLLNHFLGPNPGRGDKSEAYKEYRIDPDLAYRFRRVATLPWEQASDFNSISKCLEFLREKAPKRKPAKSKVHVAALEKEVMDLKDMISRQQVDRPDTSHYEATIQQLKRENEVLKKRNLDKVRQERKDQARIAKLEKENRDLQAQLDAVLEADDEIRSTVKDYPTSLDGETEVRNITNFSGHGQPGLDLDDYTGDPPTGKWEQLE